VLKNSAFGMMERRNKSAVLFGEMVRACGPSVWTGEEADVHVAYRKERKSVDLLGIGGLRDQSPDRDCEGRIGKKGRWTA